MSDSLIVPLRFLKGSCPVLVRQKSVEDLLSLPGTVEENDLHLKRQI